MAIQILPSGVCSIPPHGRPRPGSGPGRPANPDAASKRHTSPGASGRRSVAEPAGWQRPPAARSKSEAPAGRPAAGRPLSAGPGASTYRLLPDRIQIRRWASTSSAPTPSHAGSGRTGQAIQRPSARRCSRPLLSPTQSPPPPSGASEVTHATGAPDGNLTSAATVALPALPADVALPAPALAPAGSSRKRPPSGAGSAAQTVPPSASSAVTLWRGRPLASGADAYTAR